MGSQLACPAALTGFKVCWPELNNEYLSEVLEMDTCLPQVAHPLVPGQVAPASSSSHESQVFHHTHMHESFFVIVRVPDLPSQTSAREGRLF